MFNVYVYYRLDPRHVDEAETPIRALMASVACRCAVTAQLLKKRDESLLWMESYERVADPDTFSLELARAVDEFDVNVFIDGERHLECFHCDDTLP